MSSHASTLGRATFGFAESVRDRTVRRDARSLRARRDRCGRVARVPPRRGDVRAAASGRSLDAPGEDSPGHPDGGSARGDRRRGRSLLAWLRARDDAPECPVPLHEARRGRRGHATARRVRADDARGVRKLRAQRDDEPDRRGRARRGLRPDRLRERAHDLPPPAPAELVAPAKIQDCVHGRRRPTTPSRSSTTSAGTLAWSRSRTGACAVSASPSEGARRSTARAGASSSRSSRPGDMLGRRARDPPRLRRPGRPRASPQE